jgi:hypothetical protein
MSGENQRPAAKPSPKDKPIEQKVARTLGRAFARLKHAKPLRDAAQAYHDELDDRPRPTKP